MSTSGRRPEVSCRLLEGGSVNDRHRPRILTVSLTFCDTEGWLAPGCPAGLAQHRCTSSFARRVNPNPINGRPSPCTNRELNACTSSPVLANFVTFAQLKAVSHTDSNIAGPSKGSHAAPGGPLPSHPGTERPLVQAWSHVDLQDGLYLYSESSRTNDWVLWGILGFQSCTNHSVH